MQGILFFDRMTDGVLDSIREQLQVRKKAHSILPLDISSKASLSVKWASMGLSTVDLILKL